MPTEITNARGEIFTVERAPGDRFQSVMPGRVVHLEQTHMTEEGAWIYVNGVIAREIAEKDTTERSFDIFVESTVRQRYSVNAKSFEEAYALFRDDKALLRDQETLDEGLPRVVDRSHGGSKLMSDQDLEPIR